MAETPGYSIEHPAEGQPDLEQTQAPLKTVPEPDVPLTQGNTPSDPPQASSPPSALPQTAPPADPPLTPPADPPVVEQTVASDPAPAPASDFPASEY